MTSEEAAYLETLGFVPSVLTSSQFVLNDAKSGIITAVIERVPFSHHDNLRRWRCRKTGRPVQAGGVTRGVCVEADDLTALVVMAKLEEIL